MAAYFSPSCIDFGWITPDGVIHSGLLIPGIDSHGPMAIRLRLGGWIDAIRAGSIRWGLFNDRETVFVEFRKDLKPERALARLRMYTGAKTVVKEEGL